MHFHIKGNSLGEMDFHQRFCTVPMIFKIILLLAICYPALSRVGPLFIDEKKVTSRDKEQAFVRTSLGDILGNRGPYHRENEPRYKYFDGIPYAKPPLGDLRFKRPVPYGSWKNETGKYLQAWEKTVCAQYEPRIPYHWNNVIYNTEDCLYIQIYYREKNETQKQYPVLFVVHQEHFEFYNVVYYVARIYQNNEVMLVYPNYRVGPLGYLNTGVDDAPGNMGIHDVLLSLKWVNDHIESFGGDKNRITILGQGSGAEIVGFLASSPLAKGLFKRVIIESGSFYQHYTDGLEEGKNLAHKLNCTKSTPEETIKCLRALPYKDIFQAAHELENPYVPGYFRPRPEKDLVPTTPEEALAKDINCQELLIGVNKDEAAYLLPSTNVELFGPIGQKDPKINKTLGTKILKELVPPRYNSCKDKIVEHYLGHVNDADYYEIRRQTYTAISDLTITCPTKYFAQKAADANKNVHFYFYAMPSAFWAKWMGAVHYEEFILSQNISGYNDFTEEQMVLTNYMAKAWAEFTATGSPELKNEKWGQYKNPKWNMKVLNATAKKTLLYTQQGPRKRNCDFYKSLIFAKTSSPCGEKVPSKPVKYDVLYLSVQCGQHKRIIQIYYYRNYVNKAGIDKVINDDIKPLLTKFFDQFTDAKSPYSTGAHPVKNKDSQCSQGKLTISLQTGPYSLSFPLNYGRNPLAHINHLSATIGNQIFTFLNTVLKKDSTPQQVANPVSKTGWKGTSGAPGQQQKGQQSHGAGKGSKNG